MVRDCRYVSRILCQTELSLQSPAHFVNLIFTECSERVMLFLDFYLNPSSLYSLVHILSTSSSKVLGTCYAFLDFYVNPSALYSLVRILSTSSSKSAGNVSCFLRFYVKSSSRHSLVHILSATFPDRGAKPRKQWKQRSPSSDHGRPLLPEKMDKDRVLRPRGFSSVNSRVLDLFGPTT